MQTIEVPGLGMSSVCSECAAPEQPPRRYPAGQRIPHFGDRLIQLCGICRVALREDERIECIRLQPEDVDTDVQPGLYASCPQCLEIYRPRIEERLRDQGLLAVGATATDHQLM